MLSNGQIADEGTALKETLLAVKDVIDAHPDAGIACAFKNSGKGVGVHDVGRVKLKVRGRPRRHLHQRGLHGTGNRDRACCRSSLRATGLDKSAITRACAGHHGDSRQRHQHRIAADARHRRSRAPRCELR